MIQFVDVQKTFENKKNQFIALKDINFTINQGEVFGIIGKSGAGKSTLLRCMNLLETPTQGKVIIDGINLLDLNPNELRKKRRKIGMIFQHFNLLSHSTVFKNIALPLEVAGQSAKVTRERVEFLLDMIGMLDKINHYPDELSGGQKQRVAIARALANNPSVLLCDEATSALDTETTKSVLNLLRKINKELKLTIILVTHQIEVVKYICHRVAVMSKGLIVENSLKDDFFSCPKSLEGQSLLLTQDFNNEQEN